MGLAWICPYCKETQVSKYSHERHIAKCPHNDKTDESNPDANSAYLRNKIQLTPKAASIAIGSLTKNNYERIKIIIGLKKRMLFALKENVALKKVLELEHSDEDEEIEELQWCEKIDASSYAQEKGKEEETEIEIQQNNAELDVSDSICFLFFKLIAI